MCPCRFQAGRLCRGGERCSAGIVVCILRTMFKAGPVAERPRDRTNTSRKGRIGVIDETVAGYMLHIAPARTGKGVRGDKR